MGNFNFIKSFESFSAGSDVLGDIDHIVLHLGENLGVYYSMLSNYNNTILIFKLDEEGAEFKLKGDDLKSQLEVTCGLLEDLGYNLFMEDDYLIITIYGDLFSAGIEYLDYIKDHMVEEVKVFDDRKRVDYKDLFGNHLFTYWFVTIEPSWSTDWGLSDTVRFGTFFSLFFVDHNIRENWKKVESILKNWLIDNVDSAFSGPYRYLRGGSKTDKLYLTHNR